jgi:hypothetical protein
MTSAMVTSPSRCPHCARATVEIKLFEGDRRLTMRSCSPCDRRTWLRDGRPTTKREVLATVGAGSGRRSG